uniref:NYN domain-containing protein n=1 Tax=candidate division WOR-3 bacterium TaxID=2052148 RepID=A0A7C2K2B1_UNCW3
MSNKIAFLIDGLNFYYSVKRLKVKTNLNAKWFDYISFCDFYKLDLSKKLSKQLSIHGIFYFTSLIVKTASMSEIEFQQHRTNQLQYLKILADQGITILKGKFNQKEVKCPSCDFSFKIPVEKQTDINIASKLFEVLSGGFVDVVVIVSGDTDLVPAIETSKKAFPGKLIVVVIPYGNHSTQLKTVAHFNYSLRAEHYVKHLLPNPYRLKTGEIISKPSTW